MGATHFGDPVDHGEKEADDESQEPAAASVDVQGLNGFERWWMIDQVDGLPAEGGRRSGSLDQCSIIRTAERVRSNRRIRERPMQRCLRSRHAFGAEGYGGLDCEPPLLEAFRVYKHGSRHVGKERYAKYTNNTPI